MGGKATKESIRMCPHACSPLTIDITKNSTPTDSWLESPASHLSIPMVAHVCMLCLAITMDRHALVTASVSIRGLALPGTRSQPHDHMTQQDG